MPELPEVETVRRTLEPYIVGKSAQKIIVQRRDVVRGKAAPKALLKGRAVKEIIRHGKQLALVADTPGNEAVINIHLGMTGSLTFLPEYTKVAKDKHAHVSWQFPEGSLVFRDPRRFGGIWTFNNLDELIQKRWNKLGEDALSITPAPLYKKLSKTSRALKTALLDQNLVAGLGNIYVDEILFMAKLNPAMPARKINKDDCKKIVTYMRKILAHSIKVGGSTIRDYVSGTGEAGGFQNFHKVYGRGGEKCARCESELELIRLAGRATVFCPKCQK